MSKLFTGIQFNQYTGIHDNHHAGRRADHCRSGTAHVQEHYVGVLYLRWVFQVRRAIPLVSDDLALTGLQLRKARQRLTDAMDAAERAAIVAHHDGVPETVIAVRLGVNRMTVRRWLGKL